MVIDNVTSLTRSGVHDWFAQRVSSLIILFYVLFLGVYFIMHPHFSFWEWRDLFHSNSMRIFTLLALLNLMLHSWVGMWTILTDYFGAPIFRGTCEVLLIIALSAFFIWGIVILWSL